MESFGRPSRWPVVVEKARVILCSSGRAVGIRLAPGSENQNWSHLRSLGTSWSQVLYCPSLVIPFSTAWEDPAEDLGHMKSGHPNNRKFPATHTLGAAIARANFAPCHTCTHDTRPCCGFTPRWRKNLWRTPRDVHLQSPAGNCAREEVERLVDAQDMETAVHERAHAFLDQRIKHLYDENIAWTKDGHSKRGTARFLIIYN